MPGRVGAYPVVAAALALGGCTGSGSASGADAGPAQPDGSEVAQADAAATLPDAGSTDAASPGAPSDASDAAPPPTAIIHYLGRFDTRDPAGPRFAWPGSAIAATFTGTGIQATLTDTGSNYFAVVVDGKAPANLSTSGAGKTYTLASGLAAGMHTLVLTKKTESFVGVVQLLGLAPTGGALVPSPEPFSRRIELVGDSITCGYGDTGAGPGCSFSADTEDETLAYGALAAAQLNAQQTVIAYSGKGMYRENGGSTDDQMPVLFGRTLADDSSSVWGFTTPPPDVVVVNLSTNDFAKGDPGTAFQTAYVAFLRQVRQRYPGAYVLCALSPMLDGASRASSAAYIAGAVAQANDARISMLGPMPPLGADAGAQPFATQLASSGYGCDYHPSTQTHALMAGDLVAAIRRVTGW